MCVRKLYESFKKMSQNMDKDKKVFKAFSHMMPMVLLTTNIDKKEN